MIPTYQINELNKPPKLLQMSIFFSNRVRTSLKYQVVAGGRQNKKLCVESEEGQSVGETRNQDLVAIHREGDEV